MIQLNSEHTQTPTKKKKKRKLFLHTLPSLIFKYYDNKGALGRTILSKLNARHCKNKNNEENFKDVPMICNIY